MINEEFWRFLERLVEEHEITVDRPKGSYHPEHPSIYYDRDYGYLVGTSSPDGEEIDVWLGSEKDRKLSGVLCTVDLEKQDTELKLLLGCTPEDMQYVYDFYNSREYLKAIIIRREK